MATSTAHRPRLKAVVPRTWWLILLRGLVGIGLGFALFSQSSLNLLNLAVFMGLYWLADGIFMALVALFVRPAAERWWLLLLRGLLGVVAGFVVLNNSMIPTPDPERLLIWILAAVAIVSGGIDLIFAARIREVVDDEWAFALGAVLSIIFGVLLFLSPQVTLRLIGSIIAGFAILGGIGLVFFSFRLRKIHA